MDATMDATQFSNLQKGGVELMKLEDAEMDKNIELCKYNIDTWKNELLELINHHKKTEFFIFGYGASGRVNSILCFLDIRFDYLFEDSTSKINKITPKNHIYILPSGDIYTFSNLKTVFILAWPYAKDIIKKHTQFIKNGGKFIIVLPYIQIIDNTNYCTFLYNYIV
jgi:hypothetical protein